MNDLDALIIGGGIGGMTAALALQQRGCRVSVFEQSTEFAEVGAGLTLASNAMHVMWHLGLKEPMGQFATLPDHGAIKHYRTGKQSAGLQTTVDDRGHQRRMLALRAEER